MLNNKHLLRHMLFVAIVSLGCGIYPAAARVDDMAVVPVAAPAVRLGEGAALIARLRPRPAIFGTRAVPVAPDAAPDYNIFRSVVVPVGALPAFTQWAGVQPVGAGAGPCAGDLCATRTGRRLAAAATRAGALPPLEALRLINTEVNAAIRYRSDRGDRWASLVESAARGTGDCEDFAIAKMTLLHRAGFAPEQLQFVVLKDARKQLYHAVLAVHVEGKRYILDNLSATVATDGSFRSYVPIVSFIGARTFIHGFVGKSPAAAALGQGGYAAIRLGEGG